MFGFTRSLFSRLALGAFLAASGSIFLAFDANTSALADGPQERLAKLHGAYSITCIFNSGAIGKWTAESIDIEITHEETLVSVFNNIDLENGTAMFTSNNLPGTVIAIKTASGVAFIESVAAGSINLTFVFAVYREGTERFLATTSRNTGAIGGILGEFVLPSQYYGTCSSQ